MKKSSKIALGGIVTAVSVVLMLMTAVIPFMSYAMPLFAGTLLVIMVMAAGKSWAAVVYVAVSLLSVFIVPDKEAVTFYVAFFGYYPLIKTGLEKLPSFFSWLLKLIVFNLAVIAATVFTVKILGIPFDDMGQSGKYGYLLLLLVADFVFIIYDNLLSKLVIFYNLRFKKILKKIFK